MPFIHIYCNNNNNNNKKYRENKISKKMKSNMKTLTIFIGHATHLYRAQKRNNKKNFFSFFAKLQTIYRQRTKEERASTRVERAGKIVWISCQLLITNEFMYFIGNDSGGKKQTFCEVSNTLQSSKASKSWVLMFSS